MISHDFLVVVLSDFSELDSRSHQAIVQLSKHNELILGRINDPMEANFPEMHVSLSDGEKQIEISPKSRQQFQQLHTALENRQKHFDALFATPSVTQIDLNTSISASSQLKELIRRFA